MWTGRSRSLGAEKLITGKGYKRMLLSYLPLVLISVSAVIFISFIIVTDVMTREAEKANAVSTKQAVSTLEAATRDIETTVLRELAVNRPLYQFMNIAPGENERMIQYELSRDIHKLAEAYSAVQGIYVYRAGDGKVLTEREIVPLTQFPDKEFIAAHFPADQTQKWLPVRDYTDSVLEPKAKVISLIQRFPLPLGSEGMVVVNVNAQKLFALTEDMRSNGLSVLEVRDSISGQRITPVLHNDAKESRSLDIDDFTYRQQSGYLGWTFYSGLNEGPLFAWVSVLSYIWIGIGALVLVGTVLACIYIFKRNYRPIELLMQRIHQFPPLQHLPKQKAADEFAYIEKAIEHLVETNRFYEQRHQEGGMLGKRQFIRDWLEGDLGTKSDEWLEKARLFDIPLHSGECTVALVQIDQVALENVQIEREQRYLKFSLANVIREHWKGQCYIETEWITSDRLAVIWLHQDAGLQQDNLLNEMKTLVEWIEEHLDLQVHIGIGLTSTTYTDAVRSYHQAENALKYRMLKGRIIYYQPSPERSTFFYSYYRTIAGCIQSVHSMDETWSEQAAMLFERISQDDLSDDEIRAIMEYGVMLLLEEAESVADSGVKSGMLEHIRELRLNIERAEELQGLQKAFSRQLERLFVAFTSYKKSNKYRETINRVKQYIETNYCDPDLSLMHISDKFNLKPKYASQLFKDEFGMKFVDFLVQLRMKEAKKRLVETDESVQDIALQVGYSTSISFGRMFKKLEGITPGDYRKIRTSRNDEPALNKAAE